MKTTVSDSRLKRNGRTGQSTFKITTHKFRSSFGNRSNLRSRVSGLRTVHQSDLELETCLYFSHSITYDVVHMHLHGGRLNIDHRSRLSNAVR